MKILEFNSLRLCNMKLDRNVELFLYTADMHLLPFTSFSIETGLDRKKAMLNLMYEVKSKKTNITKDRRHIYSFTGELSGNSFKIQRRIKDHKNDSRPVIIGEIVDSFHGTEVKITMRLSYYAYVFMILWFGFLLLVIFSELANAESESNSLIIPSLMVVFGYVSTMLAFCREANKAERELFRIFDEDNKRYEFFDS